MLDHELRREQAHGGMESSSTGVAGPTMGGRVGEVGMGGSDRPPAARDEDVGEPPER